MKILVLQHFEEYWSEGLSKFGTNFEEVNSKVIDFIISNQDLDKIVITRFETYGPSDEHYQLIELCNKLSIQIEFQEYAYAWERTEKGQYPKKDEGKTWCQGTRDHHGINDVIEITEWMHDIKRISNEVFLGGAFYGECIADIQAAFESIEINYQNIEGLIVGDGYDYHFNNTPIHEVECIENELEDLNIRMEELEGEIDFDNLQEDELDILIEFETEFNEYTASKIKSAELFGFNTNVDSEKLQEMIDVTLSGELFQKYSDIRNENNLKEIKNKLDEKDKKPLTSNLKRKMKI